MAFSMYFHGFSQLPPRVPVVAQVSRTMRFCFDLDGTLVHPNESGGVEPVPNAIELVRQLHRAKHTIIITTSAWDGLRMTVKNWKVLWDGCGMVVTHDGERIP